MEILLLILVVALVVGGIAFVAFRSRGTGPVDLEPPPAPPTAPPLEPPQAAAPTLEAPPTEAPPVEAPPVEEVPVAEAPPVVEEPPVEVAPAVKPRFRDRLGKARDLLSGYVSGLLSRGVDAETWDDLEEALIRADVGVDVATTLVEKLRAQAQEQGITEGAVLLETLKADLKEVLGDADRTLRHEPGSPNVWLFVGVNGVGKTTTIGKVARQQTDEGRKVILAAGDTFRAAAVEQLAMWADRVGVEVVRGTEGGDPGAVIYDAVQAAASRGHDLVLGDTAGRLHTKVNLMEELRKVRRVADKDPGNVTEVLLVLDATTGQNGLVQAQQFTEAVDVTGVVLTKLDGTAKGGIALSIERQLGIPVKLVGLGETADDLVAFDPDEFVEALFGA